MIAEVNSSSTTPAAKPESPARKIQLVPSPARELAAAKEQIGVAFNPNAAPPAPQFTFNQANYLALEGSTMISVTLSGATFASVPVTWPSPPSGGAPAVIMTSDLQTISFEVPAPAHYCLPWIFILNVNSTGVSGITSQAFYLVKSLPEPTVELTLQYNPNGSFNLQEDGQTVLALASQQILVNVLPVQCNIKLSGATFNNAQPIVLGNGTPGTPGNPGTQPWITNFGHSDAALSFQLSGPINGQSTGFQFAVDINNLTVLSPDPIIINATIGDG